MRHDRTVLHVAIVRWQRHFTSATRSDQGATAVELGLISALIAVAILMIVVALGF